MYLVKFTSATFSKVTTHGHQDMHLTRVPRAHVGRGGLYFHDGVVLFRSRTPRSQPRAAIEPVGRTAHTHTVIHR